MHTHRYKPTERRGKPDRKTKMHERKKTKQKTAETKNGWQTKIYIQADSRPTEKDRQNRSPDKTQSEKQVGNPLDRNKGSLTDIGRADR